MISNDVGQHPASCIDLNAPVVEWQLKKGSLVWERSQDWVSQTAKRALIFLAADALGLNWTHRPELDALGVNWTRSA